MKVDNKIMSHVFNEMVVKPGIDIDTSELHFINGGLSATFFCTQQAIHAAHAINNHDRLQQENVELRGFLANLVTESIALAQFKNDTLRKGICSTDLDEPEWHDYQTIGEAGAYLESLLNKND